MKESYGQCPFCELDSETIWLETESGRAIRDCIPISKGHTMVVPKFQIPSFNDLTPGGQSALWVLVGEVRKRLNDELSPDGFNIDLNDGEAAGQTVKHAHIHVIPRWNGDVPDPRGGVRWVISDKARYWGDAYTPRANPHPTFTRLPIHRAFR